MKQILILITIVLFTTYLFAQTPEKMSYQAVIRDQNGNLKTNATIGVQITINKDGGLLPTTVYTERHTASTNANGLISFEVGSGTVINGNFSSIDWGNGSYTLNTNYDLNGGTNYSLIGSSKLLSVPYALYAKTAGNATNNTGLPSATTIGQMLYWNGTKWALIEPTSDGKTLTLENGIPVWKTQQSAINLPTVNTNTVSSITANQAYFSGYVVSGGNGDIGERGFCYGTNQNPTIQNNIVSCGNGLGSYNAIVPGLTANTNYNVRAYATNNAGTAYGNQQSFTTLRTIGDNYQGGIIAYILQPDDQGYDANIQHGLIAAPYDQKTNAEWGCYGTEIGGAGGGAIGTGKQNTIDIENGCSTVGTAADICANLELNGYNDWFLPSINELDKLYKNKIVIGNFSTGWYWSSSDYSANDAHGLLFDTGYTTNLPKSRLSYVRAVRAF